MKKLLEGCGGAHKKGFALAMADAAYKNKAGFEFHCEQCKKTFTFKVTRTIMISK